MALVVRYSCTSSSGLIGGILEYCVCEHTDPGMTLKHKDFDPFGSGRYKMVSEHMLTVGRDPRNWQAHSKDFSLQFSLSKDLLPLFSSELIQKFPLVRPYPFPLFDHTKIRLMRPLQEVQDIGQLRPLRNEEYFPCI